ncbi:MAG: GTPase domain-containing protein [Labilithrix sp.]
MPFVNEAARELNVKIAYWGPPLGGKTTNLQRLYDDAPAPTKGRLTNVATETERALFFDVRSSLPPIRGYALRFHVYTVPGSVYNAASYRTLLHGASGVVFVADSQFERLEANLEQLDLLGELLRANGESPATMPIVLQHNKRDLPNVASTRLLDRILAVGQRPSFATCARLGNGVQVTFDACAQAVHAELVRGGRR